MWFMFMVDLKVVWRKLFVLFPEKHLICLFFCFADYDKVGVSLLQNDRFSTFYLLIFSLFIFYLFFSFSKEGESDVFVIYLRQAGLAGGNIVLSLKKHFTLYRDSCF